MVGRWWLLLQVLLRGSLAEHTTQVGECRYNTANKNPTGHMPVLCKWSVNGTGEERCLDWRKQGCWHTNSLI